MTLLFEDIKETMAAETVCLPGVDVTVPSTKSDLEGDTLAGEEKGRDKGPVDWAHRSRKLQLALESLQLADHRGPAHPTGPQLSSRIAKDRPNFFQDDSDSLSPRHGRKNGRKVEAV